MVDLLLNGKISINGDYRLFYNEFAALLRKHNTSFRGDMSVIQFDDVEIINEDGKEV